MNGFRGKNTFTKSPERPQQTRRHETNNTGFKEPNVSTWRPTSKPARSGRRTRSFKADRRWRPLAWNELQVCVDVGVGGGGGGVRVGQPRPS